VGTYSRMGVGFRGFIYDLASEQYLLEIPTLEPNGLGWSGINAINEAGQCCGFRSIGSKGDPVNPYTAFIYDFKTREFVDLGLVNEASTEAADINETAQVAVNGISAVGQLDGFLWNGSSVIDLGPIPGGTTSTVNGLNDTATLVGAGGIIIDGMLHILPMRHQDGELTILPVLEGYPHGSLVDVSNTGLGIGACSIDSNNRRATLWHGDMVMDLNAMLLADEVDLDVAMAVTDLGHVLAMAEDGEGDVVGILLAPIPVRTGDTNCDGHVDVDDLFSVIGDWGRCEGCSTDFSKNGIVDLSDLFIVLDNWDF
jgi:hypothetical protein